MSYPDTKWFLQETLFLTLDLESVDRLLTTPRKRDGEVEIIVDRPDTMFAGNLAVGYRF